MIEEHEQVLVYIVASNDEILGRLAADLLELSTRGALRAESCLRTLGRDYPTVQCATLEHFIKWEVLRRFAQENTGVGSRYLTMGPERRP